MTALLVEVTSLINQIGASAKITMQTMDCASGWSAALSSLLRSGTQALLSELFQPLPSRRRRDSRPIGLNVPDCGAPNG